MMRSSLLKVTEAGRFKQLENLLEWKGSDPPMSKTPLHTIVLHLLEGASLSRGTLVVLFDGLEPKGKVNKAIDKLIEMGYVEEL